MVFLLDVHNHYVCHSSFKYHFVSRVIVLFSSKSTYTFFRRSLDYNFKHYLSKKRTLKGSKGRK